MKRRVLLAIACLLVGFVVSATVTGVGAPSWVGSVVRVVAIGIAVAVVVTGLAASRDAGRAER